MTPSAGLRSVEVILDNVPSAVVVKDADGLVHFANAAYAALHGRTVADVVGRPESDFIPASNAARFHADDMAVMEANRPVQYEDELPTAAGTRYFRTVKLPLADDDGRVWAVCAMATEITSERQLEAELRASRDQLARLAERAPGMVYQFRRRADGGYDLPYSSHGIRGVFEFEPEDVADDASPLFTRVHPDDLAAFTSSIEASERDGAPWQLEFRVVLPSRGLRWIRASSTPETTGGATVWHGYAEDVTDRVLDQQALWHRANYDSLTGLPNRDLAIDRLEQAIRLSHRGRTGLTLLFADLDGFKAVNDSLGHAAGDRLLAEVGRRLRLAVRESDTVARFGGDEFLVLLHDTREASDADRVLSALQAIAAEPFDLGDDEVSLKGFTMGLAHYPDDGEGAEALLAVADARMYEGKAARRVPEE